MPTRSRLEFQITIVPDPILRETLENLNFSFLPNGRRWVRTCDPREAKLLERRLRERSIPFEVKASQHIGRLVRWPKLSDELAIPDGGTPHQCGLCGREEIRCVLYVECDDADNPDYADPAKFFVCRDCARKKIGPHPRLYIQVGELDGDSDEEDDDGNHGDDSTQDDSDGDDSPQDDSDDELGDPDD